MYSTKEKLTHFHKLVSPTVVEADLALLHEKAPHLTDFTRFDLSPEKNHEEILFLLLDHCEHDEIVRNRREFAAKAANEDNNDDNANNSSEEESKDNESTESSTEEKPLPSEDKDTDSSKQEKAKATPKKKKKSTRK